MKTILIIEDNADILENTAELLALSGYTVVSAANGREGVERASDECPDLILCDIMMPVLDGFGVFLNLNKNPLTAGIPFIFLTAKTELVDKKYGIRLGADDYIVKPYDPEILLTTIKSRIEKHEQTKQKIERQLLGYVNELEEMLRMTSHRVRAPLCACQGLMQVIDLSGKSSLDEDELKKVLEHIRTNVNEMEGFTRELTDFLSQARERKLNTLNKSSDE